MAATAAELGAPWIKPSSTCSDKSSNGGQFGLIFWTVSTTFSFEAASVGENAIAAFSFAGLTFPGGEMPARLICRPYFCRWKVTGLCLPVLKCH